MGEIDRLRDEVASLRGENEALRRQLGIESRPADPELPAEEQRQVRVLLYPNAEQEVRRGRPSGVSGSVAQTMLGILRERQPDVEWRAECDLERVPDHAACHQLGNVVTAMWDGAGVPATFVVERSEKGPRLCRRLVEGEPASEEYSAGLDRLFADFDDLRSEAEAALRAGAGHHVGWALRAMDVVLASLNLAMASFECGEDRWREVLRKPRPEFETAVAGLEVGAQAPIGQ